MRARFRSPNLVPAGFVVDHLSVGADRICQRLGHGRRVVRAVLRGERMDIFRVRQSSLEAYLPWLDTQWDVGNRNATELWRKARAQGFRGLLRVIGE